MTFEAYAQLVTIEFKHDECDKLRLRGSCFVNINVILD